tara:strand:+ start:55 stop:534 length:480 start_codon:yes stop_codon:yes gene_type:complete
MNKFIKIIIISLGISLITSCSYEPILLKKNYAFKIEKLDLTGERNINLAIKRNLNFIKKEDENLNKKKYYLTIDTTKERRIVSKDSKGDPSKFEIIITANFQVNNDQKVLIKRKFVKKNIYNNNSDKFELEQTEKIIIDNLSEKIADNIISALTNINDN